jgi:Ca2+-binding EF-hand superfamily protein
MPACRFTGNQEQQNAVSDADQGMLASVLDYAEQELQDLCSTKPTEEEKERCWQVYDYYNEKRQQAESGCAVELNSGDRQGSGCQSLDSLGKLVYEVAYSGDAEQLRHVLEAENNAEKRRAAGTNRPATPLDMQQLLDGLKVKALALFADIDTDGNGVIDREEFLVAMQQLQHALSDGEMALVFGCMESNGCITPQQFVDIVQAEALQDPAADAAMLRATPHSRPGWWSEPMKCVSDV